MVKSPNSNKKNNCFYCTFFCDSCFFLKYFLHFWHRYASTIFFTWIIIEIRLHMSFLWKQFPNKMLHQKKITKNTIFLLQAGDLNISNILKKIQNFNWCPVFPAITDFTYNCLSPWALAEIRHVFVLTI